MTKLRSRTMTALAAAVHLAAIGTGWSPATALAAGNGCASHCRAECTPNRSDCSHRLQHRCYTACMQSCTKCESVDSLCPSGGTECTGPSAFGCTDFDNDADNCGECGLACGDFELCSAGACVCGSDATACPRSDGNDACCDPASTCRGSCSANADCCDGSCMPDNSCCPAEATCDNSTSPGQFCCDAGKYCTQNFNTSADPDACCPPESPVACEGNCCQAGQECSFDVYDDDYGCCQPGQQFFDGACCGANQFCEDVFPFCCTGTDVCTPNFETAKEKACCPPGTEVACNSTCCQAGDTCAFDEINLDYACCPPGTEALVNGACCPTGAVCSGTGPFCCPAGTFCTDNVSSGSDPVTCCAAGTDVACDKECCAAGEQCVLGSDTMFHCAPPP